jgi:trypsin
MTSSIDIEVPSTVIATDENNRRKKRRPIVAGVIGALLLVAVVTFSSVAVAWTRSKNDGEATSSSTLANNVELVANADMSGATRIIGGTEAVEDRFSYALSLQAYGTTHYCGGSLIAKDVVLTAAHCEGGGSWVYHKKHDLDETDADAVTLRVKSTVPHPYYNSYSTDNDFMLYFLEPHEGNLFDEDPVIVKLNSNPSVPTDDQMVTVMGWGDTTASAYSSTTSDVLMNVELKVVPNDICEQSTGYADGQYMSYYGKISDNMLCAKGTNQDSCQGDSGGPLIVKTGVSNGQDVQIGVVSWGAGCGSDDFPGVYARVSQAYNWIQEEVCKGSSYASEAGFDCDGIAPTIDESDSPVTAVPVTNPPISTPTEEEDDEDGFFSFFDFFSSLFG